MNSADSSGIHPAMPMPSPARAGGAGHGVRRRHVLGALAGGGAGLAGAAQAAPAAGLSVVQVASNEAAELLKGLRRRGSRLFMYGPSFIEPRLLHEWAGAAAATGVGLSQYLPNPFNTRLPLVAQYQEALRKHGSAQDRIGSLTFEGYVAGRVLCEALGRLRGEPSAGRLRDALEGLDALELGGLPLGYGPRKHVGLQYMEIGVLGGGRLNY